MIAADEQNSDAALVKPAAERERALRVATSVQYNQAAAGQIRRLLVAERMLAHDMTCALEQVAQLVRREWIVGTEQDAAVEWYIHDQFLHGPYYTRLRRSTQDQANRANPR